MYMVKALSYQAKCPMYIGGVLYQGTSAKDPGT